MFYESTRGTAKVDRLISQFAIMTIALAVAAIVAVSGIQNTYAASPSPDYRDGALMDAVVTGPPAAVAARQNFLQDGVRDAARIQFEEDNWLLVDPAAGESDEHEIRYEAWNRFIEDSVLYPSAASRSKPVQLDNADRIAALDSDFLDVSLTNDYYRNQALADDEADSTNTTLSSLDW